MSHARFTNRHGKRLDVVEEVVQHIALESVAAPSPALQTRPAKSNLKRRLRFLSITVAAVIVVTLGVCTFALLTVDAARREYQRQTSAIQSRFQEIARQPFGAETPAVDVYRQLTERLAASENCAVDGPRLLIERYQPALDAQAACQAVAMQYANIVARLDDMGSTAVYLERQYQIVAPALARPADGTFAEIPAMDEAWVKAHTELGALEVPEDLSEAHRTLVDRVHAVGVAWQTLRTAHDAQQTEVFRTAETALAQAYEALRLSGDEFMRLLHQRQDELTAAVANFVR